MTSNTNDQVIRADAIPLRKKASNYPAEIQALLAERLKGREKRQLGEHFGLSNFGVNLTSLAPGSSSALLHRHTKQDEFIYILTGQPTLRTDRGTFQMEPGMCAGFKAGSGPAHQLINNTLETVTYLEVGDRTAGDEASYPEDDLEARSDDGKWVFFHKDGTPYQ